MEKNNKGIILILVIIIIILAILCTLFATRRINLDSNEETDCIQTNNIDNNNKSNKITGVYKATYNVSTGDPNMECSNYIYFTLKLYEDGTFEYTRNRCISSGTIGNYAINGNQIILTHWFSTGNGTGIFLYDNSGGIKNTITINTEGELLENNIDGISEIKLVKTQDALGENYLKQYLQQIEKH